MLSFPEAAEVLGSELLLEEYGLSLKSASIDTRTLEPGDLFVALKGEKDDGHRFLAAAFEKGAGGALLSEGFILGNPEVLHEKKFRNLIPVRDPQKALADLAAAWRSRFKIPVIAITGSVGKTSTKEFLAYVLGRKFSVHATKGNFNNHLGLPLTLLQMKTGHEIVVAELGANHVGEISGLGKILKQDRAILTQVAPVHLEGFGSLENIYKAKLEILEPLAEKGWFVIPDDDAKLADAARACRILFKTAGFTPKADYRISDARTEKGKVHFTVNEKFHFSFPGLAPFLAKNATLALAMAETCGLTLQDLAGDWADFKLAQGRFQAEEVSGISVIFDGYNASPVAFEAALTAFSALQIPGKKFLVFADMLELGPEEEKFHEELGFQIARAGLAGVFAYGRLAKISLEALKRINPSLLAVHFESAAEAGAFLASRIGSGDAVLLKASRGMRVEEALKILKGEPRSAEAVHH